MKGIILAGDSGSKLHPITLAIPKQLLPIYDRPMIYYPIETLVNVGITDLLIITTEEHQLLFQKALRDGCTFGASLSYAVQKEPNGIAQAIYLGKEFVGSDGFCLITGDTIIEGQNLNEQIKKAIRTVNKSGNATIFVENKTYPDQYGKVVFSKTGKVQEIIGDNDVNHYYSIASLYVFPNSALKFAENLRKSERGLFEITDLNKRFFDNCKLQVRMLDRDCIWFDTNTFDNILKCSEYMSKKSKN